MAAISIRVPRLQRQKAGNMTEILLSAKADAFSGFYELGWLHYQYPLRTAVLISQGRVAPCFWSAELDSDGGRKKFKTLKL